MTAYRVRNWSSYNRSLVNRGDITLWVSEEIIKNWTANVDRRAHGNQRFSDAVIRTSYVLKQIFRLPLRATSGFLSSILKLINLPLKAPDYSTICRRGKRLQISLAGEIPSNGRHVLIDATGVRVFGEGEWKVFMHGQSRHQLWRKLHLAIDADTQMILAGKITESVRLDCNYLPALLKDIEGPIRQVTGDAAYDKKLCYRAAFERNAKAVFPPQKNSAIQRNRYKRDPALAARDEAIMQVGTGIDRNERLTEWKKTNDYHRRSLAETVMSRLKHIFSDEVRARSFENQTTELLTRCYALNLITQLGLPTSEKIL